MKALIASIFALTLLGAAAANADGIGVGAHIGGVGAGVHVGGGDVVGGGAHIGSVGAGAHVGIGHRHYRHCDSWGWSRRLHERYCRSWN